MNSTLSRCLRVLHVRWRWCLWGVLLAVAVATLLLLIQPPMYQSDATIFIRTPGDVSRKVDGGDAYAQGRARTYAELANSTNVSARVISDLSIDLDPETLAKRIKGTVRPGTVLVDITVSARSQAEAQRIATVFLEEYAATAHQLESVPGLLVPRAELVVVNPPGHPTRLIAWGVPLPIVLLTAALIGLMAGVTAAVSRVIAISSVRERFDVSDSTVGESRGTAGGTGDDASGRSSLGQGVHCARNAWKRFPGSKIDLRASVAAVRRHRLTFSLVTGAVFLIGLIPILVFPTPYGSSTRLLVSIEESTTSAASQTERIAARRVLSYIPLLTSGVVMQRVIDKLGLPMTSSQLAAKITTTHAPTTPLIDIEVTDDSSARAQQIAETVAAEFISYTSAVETPTGEDSQKIKTTVVGTATQGQRMNPFERLLLGALAALAAVFAGAVAVWNRSTKESVPPDSEQDTGDSGTPSIDIGDHAQHRAKEIPEPGNPN